MPKAYHWTRGLEPLIDWRCGVSEAAGLKLTDVTDFSALARKSGQFFECDAVRTLNRFKEPFDSDVHTSPISFHHRTRPKIRGEKWLLDITNILSLKSESFLGNVTCRVSLPI